MNLTEHIAYDISTRKFVKSENVIKKFIDSSTTVPASWTTVATFRPRISGSVRVYMQFYSSGGGEKISWAFYKNDTELYKTEDYSLIAGKDFEKEAYLEFNPCDEFVIKVKSKNGTAKIRNVSVLGEIIHDYETFLITE